MELGADLGHGIEVIYGCRNGQILVDELAGFVRGIHRLPEYRDLPTTRYGMPANEFQRKIAQAEVTKPTEDLWRAMLAGRFVSRRRERASCARGAGGGKSFG